MAHAAETMFHPRTNSGLPTQVTTDVLSAHSTQVYQCTQTARSAARALKWHLTLDKISIPIRNPIIHASDALDALCALRADDALPRCDTFDEAVRAACHNMDDDAQTAHVTLCRALHTITQNVEPNAGTERVTMAIAGALADAATRRTQTQDKYK